MEAGKTSPPPRRTQPARSGSLLVRSSHLSGLARIDKRGPTREALPSARRSDKSVARRPSFRRQEGLSDGPAEALHRPDDDPGVRRVVHRIAGSITGTGSGGAAEGARHHRAAGGRLRGCHGEQGEAPARTSYYPRIAGKPRDTCTTSSSELPPWPAQTRRCVLLGHLSDDYLLEIADCFSKLRRRITPMTRSRDRGGLRAASRSSPRATPPAHPAAAPVTAGRSPAWSRLFPGSWASVPIHHPRSSGVEHRRARCTRPIAWRDRDEHLRPRTSAVSRGSPRSRGPPPRCPRPTPRRSAVGVRQPDAAGGHVMTCAKLAPRSIRGAACRLAIATSPVEQLPRLPQPTRRRTSPAPRRVPRACRRLHRLPYGARRRAVRGRPRDADAFRHALLRRTSRPIRDRHRQVDRRRFLPRAARRQVEGRLLLYPAFPYPSYTKVTRADSDAIYALLPVDHAGEEEEQAACDEVSVQPAQPADRAGARCTSSRANTSRIPSRRGVESRRLPGPRPWPLRCLPHEPQHAGGDAEGKELSGGLIPLQDWYAPSLTSNREAGLGQWAVEEVVALLRTGFSNRGVVFGPMAQVVHDSLQYITEADTQAMAVYLKSLAPPVRRAIRGSCARPRRRAAPVRIGREGLRQALRRATAPTVWACRRCIRRSPTTRRSTWSSRSTRSAWCCSAGSRRRPAAIRVRSACRRSRTR